MRVLLAVHGYPPELIGGTELAAERLARGLMARGHEVTVVAGSLRAADTPPDAREVRVRREELDGVKVLRLSRPDLYFDHWQKSRSVRVNASLREVLREVRPDVLHVLHWLRLSRQLVATAAEEGVPSVVSLNDAWVSCPLAFRVDPRSGEACERPHAGLTCVRCAGSVPPLTPWVPLEGALLEFAERERDLLRELELARVVLAPTRGHAERLASFVEGFDAGAVRVAPPAAPPEELTSAGPSTAPPTAPPLVALALGSLSRLKGTDLLLEAARDARLAGRLRWVLAGAEERPGELDLEVDGVEVLSGYAPRDLADPATAVGRAARAAHVFVSASRAAESFALVLDEARALGLPQVAPGHGAFLERAGPDTLHFEPGDAESLAGVLAALVQDPRELERRRACVQPATSESAVLDAHLAAYDEAARLGAPRVPSASDWYSARLALFAEEAWDQALSRETRSALGLDT